LNSKQPWNKESGASLVAILVSMALFGIIAVMASQGYRNISVSGRRVEAAVSAREVENVILQAMVQKFSNFIEDACPAGGTYFNNMVIGRLARVNYRNIRFYDANHLNLVRPPEMALKDLERCNSTAFSSTTPINSNTFYGCFDLKTVDEARISSTNTNLKASNDAFAANRGAFIEMYVKLRNLKTDTPALCNQMIKDRGFGMEVYYALHWTTPAGGSVMYDSKLGTINANYRN
jgi:type II secretory pathway pseudopilin PulG